MPGFAITGNEGRILPDSKAEFHRAHRWRISSIGAPAGITNITSTTGIGSSSGAFVLPLYAKSLQLPSISFEEVKIKAGSVTYKFPKRADWDNVTVEFYDVYGLHRLFDEWRKKIWTPDEGIKLAAEYMGVPRFILSDGMGDTKQSFELINAYPQSIKHSELTYTSSDVKLLTIVYSYSHAIVNIYD